ncbi:MAG: MlaD family protein [Planctomycetes bacterium]|nr:MlaD family protein [Planctomycetota bacterium]
MAAESRVREIIVGVMFFAALLLFLGFAVIIAGQDLGFGEKAQRVLVRFKNTYGIVEGTPVNLNGNKVGKVVGMFNNIELGRVDVELSIKADVMLHRGVTVEIQSTIFGTRTVEIHDNPIKENFDKFIDMSKPILGFTVPDVFLQVGKLSGKFDEMLDNVDDILMEIKSAVTSLNTPDSGIIGKFVSDREFADKVDDMVLKLSDTIVEFKTTAEELTTDLKLLRQGEGVVSLLINDPSVAQDIRQAIADVRTMTSQFSDVVADVGSITKKIEKEEGIIGWLVGNEKAKEDFAEISNALREASPEIEKSIENIESITRKIDVGQGTIGKLINDDELMIQIESALDSAGRAIDDMRETLPITTFTSLLFSAFQ